MSETNATAWLSGRMAGPEPAIAAARLLIGAAHRRAWVGPDPDGDRSWAIARLREVALALATPHPALAAILDWWLVAAAEDDGVGLAYGIDRQLPSPTGEALKEILESGLGEVRRPVRFAQVLDELRTLSDRNPGKIAGDKPIFQTANDECRRVLRAAAESRPFPERLRLDRLDQYGAEAWASEGGGGTRRVEPGTPVWDHLVKQLLIRADAVALAKTLWPGPDRARPRRLPNAHERQVCEAAGDAADLALALVQDALPEPPERLLLGPDTVRRALRAPPSADALAVFRLAREAWSDAPDDRPDWVARQLGEIERTSQELDAREYEGDAAQYLALARESLTALQLQEARDWMKAADTEHQKATRGAARDREAQVARERAATLTALKVPVPAPGSDGASWALVVNQAWSEARRDLKRRAEALEAAAALLGTTWTGTLMDELDRATGALDRDQLREAAAGLDRTEKRLTESERALDQRLGPDLAALRGRLRELPVGARAALLAAIERLSALRDHGVDRSEDAVELRELLDVVQQGRAPAAVCIEIPGARPTRVAWVLAGVSTVGEETRSAPSARLRGVRVVGAPPTDAAARVDRWGEVVTLGMTATSPARLFLREGETVAGPYRLDGEDLVPEHPELAVGVLPESRFAALFGPIELGGGRSLVPRPPALGELLAVGAEIRDELDDASLAAWLAEQVDGAPPAEAIARWLRVTEGSTLPAPVAEARLARMTRLLDATERLERHRDAAIQRFLASDEGAAAIAQAADARIAEEVARRRDDVEAAIAAARAEVERLTAEAGARRRELDEALARVREDLAVAEEALEDRKLRLIAALGGGRGPGTAASPAPPASPPLRAGPFSPTETPDLPALVRDLAGSTWDRDEVANLLLSVATGRWTLLAGLPGVGKSTFVRSVLSRLGHGPGTDRYLELVVRRDWQDDAALFGFWHPTERSWSPSSEGFVEHLLRAHDDAARGQDGLWPVLIEELNLASPEYYLARPISAFEAAGAELRLYDAALGPVNAARYPPAFAVPDSVRLVGTVNVDDTVERLSPRFLSRASVIWVEPSADAAPWRVEDDVPRHRVRWAALSGLTARGGSDLGPIREVVDFLQAHRIPGAPTVRTQRAIGRYLGAATGLLAPSRAQDLQVLQRILPPIRGTGPRWRGVLDALADLLEKRGWARSATRTRELRMRGEELGDWYDFFHA